MHTEHLQNVRPSWIAFGWFLAAAATGLVVFVLIRFGLLDAEGGGTGWLLPAFAAGFFFGGWVTGLRTGGAPILGPHRRGPAHALGLPPILS